MGETIQDAIGRLSWGVRGLLLLAACLVATLFSPVLSYSCGRDAGRASCRVTRHALAVVPYWWTTIAPVVDADSDFTPRSRVRASSGGWAIAPSVTTNRIRAEGQAAAWEATTYASIGAEPGTIAIAIDELVEGKREQPFLAWQADTWVVFFVFVVALPFASAMMSRPYCERFVPRQGWLRAIERTYVAALLFGCAVSAAIFWGSLPEPLGRALGLPTG